MSAPASTRTLRGFAGEGLRYVVAGGAAFCLDFTLYSSLIRLAGLHYLVAAPIAFAAGLALVYALSVRWVFRARRLRDARLEFAVFAAIGLGGMAVNEGLLYLAVEHAAYSYEFAKVFAAGGVFAFNFLLRKLLLFTRY